MVILNHKLLFHTKKIRGIADRINDKRDNGRILARFRPPTPHKKKKRQPEQSSYYHSQTRTWDSVSTYITKSN